MYWEVCHYKLWFTLMIQQRFEILFEHHMNNLERVLRRIWKAKLKLTQRRGTHSEWSSHTEKISLCLSGKLSTCIMWFPVKASVSLDPEKTVATTKWPVSWDVKNFLELCTCYQCFIKGFSYIARPLWRKLTPKKRSFAWDEDCWASFNNLKEMFSSVPILCYPRSEFKFILYTDTPAKQQ